MALVGLAGFLEQGGHEAVVYNADLANENERSDEGVSRLVGFWAGLGARSAVMSASEHDRLVARRRLSV